MALGILTRCYRDAIYAATSSIATLAKEAGYAVPTVEMYLYQRRPSAQAARALATALENRAARLTELAAQLRSATGEPPRGRRRRRRRAR